MTTTIIDTNATFYINNPGTITGSFSLKSQYSQEVVYTTSNYSVDVTNDRYATITVTFPADFKDKHANGYYTWSIGDYSDIVKIITVPGGDSGKVEYISNNEDREADVFYRPNYT